MTADTLDLEALHAALEGLHAELDARPDDQVVRSVMADLYADLGDDATAEGLRWMAGRGKHPDVNRRLHPDAVTPWRWLIVRAGDTLDLRQPDIPDPHYVAFPPHARIDIMDIDYDAAYRTEHGVGLRNYPTRREAEEAMCRALALT